MTNTTLNSISTDDWDDWGHVICFPHPDRECVQSRIEKLVSAGVATLLSEGRKSIGELKVLGKGHASVVIKAVLNPSLTVAIKVRRTDSKRDSLRLECEVMRVAYPVAPKVYHCEDDFIIMEYVDGVPIGKVMEKAATVACECNKALSLVLKVLGAARYLDTRGIDHKELSLLKEHVLVMRDGRVKIIDYESASLSEAPCNVCRACSWFIYRSVFGKACCKELEHLRTRLRAILREYKVRAADEAFKAVINAITRSCSAGTSELRD